MRKSVLNEIEYIKYLLGYEKGKVISEQKRLISEQSKADYDKIISDLTDTYKSTLQKYGYESMYLMGPETTGTKPVISVNYGDNEPTILAFVPTATALAEAKKLGIADGKKESDFTTYVTYGLKTGGFGSDNTFNTRLYLQRYYTNTLGLKDEESKSTARYKVSSDMSTIGFTISGLVTKVKGKQDISGLVKTIKTDVAKATGGVKSTSKSTAGSTTAGTSGTAATDKTSAAKVTYTSNKGSMDPMFSEPIVEVNYDKAQQKFTVEVFATFSVMSTDAGSVEDAIIEALKEKVFTNEDVINNKDYLAMSFAKIRAGASNYYNKNACYADVKFEGTDYKNVKEPTEADQINPVNGVVEPPGVRSAANIKLAQDRATAFLKKLKTKLPSVYNKDGVDYTIKISPALKSELIGHSVATGGVIDSSPNRDWNKYPVPGQHVYAVLEITLASIPTKVQSKKCLVNAKLAVGYYKDKSTKNHECDYAVFDIFLNDVLLGSVDMGNGIQLSSSNLPNAHNVCTGIKLSPRTTAYEKCVKSFGKKKNLSNTLPSAKVYAGSRYAEFIINNDIVDSIVNASESGEIKVTIQGKQSDWYNSSSGLGLDDFDWTFINTTHAEVPWVTFFPSVGGKVGTTPTVNGESLSTMQRCGGANNTAECEKVNLFYINPCEVNNKYSVISKGG